jgi:signal peptidase I
LSWDVDTHEFHYSWTEDTQHNIPDPTIIVVPTARQFPQGFRLTATPGDSVEIDGDRVNVRADRHNAVHSIEIHSNRPRVDVQRR